MDDSKIIALFNERSELAIFELSEKYGAILRRTASNILSDSRDTEECLNEAYYGVWNTIPPQNPNPLLSYVSRILRNIAVNRYHSNTAKKRNSFYDISLDELENCFLSSTDTEQEFSARETARSIDRFLGTLSKGDRVLFVRRYFFSDSVSALSDLFGIPTHNVSARLYRIRGKLKKHLEKEGVLL